MCLHAGWMETYWLGTPPQDAQLLEMAASCNTSTVAADMISNPTAELGTAYQMAAGQTPWRNTSCRVSDSTQIILSELGADRPSRGQSQRGLSVEAAVVDQSLLMSAGSSGAAIMAVAAAASGDAASDAAAIDKGCAVRANVQGPLPPSRPSADYPVVLTPNPSSLGSRSPRPASKGYSEAAGSGSGPHVPRTWHLPTALAQNVAMAARLLGADGPACMPPGPLDARSNSAVATHGTACTSSSLGQSSSVVTDSLRPSAAQGAAEHGEPDPASCTSGGIASVTVRLWSSKPAWASSGASEPPPVPNLSQVSHLSSPSAVSADQGFGRHRPPSASGAHTLEIEATESAFGGRASSNGSFYSSKKGASASHHTQGVTGPLPHVSASRVSSVSGEALAPGALSSGYSGKVHAYSPMSGHSGAGLATTRMSLEEVRSSRVFTSVCVGPGMSLEEVGMLWLAPQCLMAFQGL